MRLATRGFFTGVTILLVVMICLPVITIAILAIFPKENIWPHLVSTVLPDYLLNTLLLMILVAVGSLFLGVLSAWLVNTFEFPGRRHFRWALLLPFAMPAYVIAYVYTDLLEYAGPVQTLIRDVFGWETARDYWFPAIRSLGGAACMLSLVLYPYVYLLTSMALREQSSSLINVARSSGMNARRVFFHVTLPVARPAIIVGLAMVMMETLNDFGTVDYFAVRTLTAGIFDVWHGGNNLGGGAQIASMLMLFALTMIAMEQFSRRKQRHYQISGSVLRKPEMRQLSSSRATLAVMICILPLLFGFVVPAYVLLAYTIEYFDLSWTGKFQRTTINSILVASIGAAITVLCALLLTYGLRLSKKSKALLIGTRVACAGYAIPGAVLAIGVLIPFSAFDTNLDALMRSNFEISTGLLLTDTMIILVFAYMIRFMAVAFGSIDASLGTVTPTMDMAARTMGFGPFSILRLVHLPLIRTGLLTAFLIVFVDCLKELPATLILRPFNFDTLATYVYQYATDEVLEEAAPAALLIILSGLIPVLLLTRSIDTGIVRQKE